MHIAQIVSTYPPYKGGMGNVAAGFSSGLRQRGYKVSIFTPKYNDADLREGARDDGVQKEGARDDVQYIKPAFSFSNSAYLPQMYSMLEGIDLIHLHYPFHGGAEVVAHYKKKHKKVPLVLTYHMDNIGHGLYKAFFQMYKRTFFPWIVNKADVITCSSLDYARHSNIKKYFGKKEIVELPIGVPDNFIPLGSRLENSVLQLLFVANLDKAHYFKGLTVLFDALEKLSKDGVSNFKLTVVGGGDQKNYYQDYVKKLGLESLVSWAGKLSDEELVSAYQASDLTILPSIDASEAYGMVLVESMACGTPVIASDLPGVRSVVSNVTGLLVKPNSADSLASAIELFIKDPNKLVEMRIVCAERVDEKYRWPRIIDNLELIYSELL